MLAGFSFAVGQSVNDIIALLRNPDQLLAFVDLAKAIYDPPAILGTLVGAFVDTFQRFQNVQNPFPGPQNLLNPTNPESFTNDNSTFGRTWFGGYGLGFVALGILSGGASAAGLTALEGVSVTAANAIRFVISAPSLLASRAAGIVGKSALRVAVRVGRATELRVSAVKRAVSGLPTPRLQRVSRSMRRLDDDLEEAVTRGCGGGLLLAGGDCLDEELTRLVRARRAGLTLVNRLPTDRAVRLLGDVDLETQKLLVRAWDDADADVDLADVQAVVARYRSLDAADQQRFARVVPEATDEVAVEFVEAMDAPDLRQFLGLAEEVPDGRLQRFVTRTGEEGAEFVGELSDAGRRRLFTLQSRLELSDGDKWDDWRATLVRVSQDSRVELSDLDDYLSKLDRIAEKANVENPGSLVTDVTNNDARQLLSTLSEVDRTVAYERRADRVKVEPDDNKRLDLLVDFRNEAGLESMEVKRPRSLSDDSFRQNLFGSSGVNGKFADTDLATNKRTGMLDVSDLDWDSVGTVKERVQRVINDEIDIFGTDLEFNRIRVVLDESTELVSDVDDSGTVTWRQIDG